MQKDLAVTSSKDQHFSTSSSLEYFNQGISLAKCNELQEAIKCYQNAIETEPKSAPSYSDLAILLKEKGFPHDDLIDIFHTKADFFAKKGQLQEAIAYYQQALRIDSNHAYILYNIARLYEEDSQLDEAKASFEKASMFTNFSSQSDVMAIFLSARYGKFGRYSFHFLRMSNEFNVKKIFLRDIQDVWYNKGLPGIAKDIDEIAVYLKNKIIEQKSRKVVILGPSAGGYASLLLGWLLEVDEVHAFCPQTKIVPRNSDEEVRLRNLDTKYFDLSKLFALKTVKTEFHIYFDNTYNVDVEHAQRMEHFPNVEIHGYPAGVGHLITGWLKDNGYLREILLQALG